MSEQQLRIFKFICKLDTDSKILPINIVLNILYVHDDWPCILYPIVKSLLFAESKKKFINIVKKDLFNIIHKYSKNDKREENKIIDQLIHYIEYIFIPLIKEKNIEEECTNEDMEQKLSFVNKEKFGNTILQYKKTIAITLYYIEFINILFFSYNNIFVHIIYIIVFVKCYMT